MNTQKITKLLDQIGSTAHGLSGVTWAAKFRIKDQSYLAEQAEGMQVQLDNLQAALDDLKKRGIGMKMTYRCKSCGSNSTADLQCDYCGAGTRKRRKSRPPQPIPAKMYGALVVLVAATFVLLMTGVQS